MTTMQKNRVPRPGTLLRFALLVKKLFKYE